MLFYTPGNHKNHGLRHDPFKAMVSPRPIGWISTIDENGVSNLAPFSFYNAIADSPPIVGFAPSPLLAADAGGVGQGTGGKTGNDKDTLTNVRATKCFVVNVVGAAQMDAMNQSSKALAYGDSEFAHAGLEELDSEKVAAKRVGGAPCHLECKLWDITALPPGPDGQSWHWVMGEVVGVHIDEKYLKDGLLDVAAFRPVSRLGYKYYAIIEKLIELERPV